MSHSDVDASEASDWQSCSEASEPVVQITSAEARTRTLKFSADDPFTHEPSNRVCPLLAPLDIQSIDNNSLKSPLTSSTSLESLRRSLSTPLPSRDLEPQSSTSSAFALRDASRPVFLLPIPTYHVASVAYPSSFAGMDTVNVPELVERLGSEEDAVRKMAVFKLQSNIGDPSFAEIFIQEGGLQKLKYLTMHASGNTLAYSLTSFSRLLEVDKGWDFVEQDLIERVGSRHSTRMYRMAEEILGCRAGCHSSAGQYPSGSHVCAGSDRVTSLQFQSIVRKHSVWFQSPQAGDHHLSSIP